MPAGDEDIGKKADLQIFSLMCSILNINEILPFYFKPFILQTEFIVQFTQTLLKKITFVLTCATLLSKHCNYSKKAPKMLKKFLWDGSVRASLDGVNIPISASLCRATLGINMAVSVWIGHNQMGFRQSP